VVGHYTHAKQFKRNNRALRFLPTQLARLIRDIGRKSRDDAAMTKTSAISFGRALPIQMQKRRHRGWKLYSWHALETDCIGNGKARALQEFGCKVLVTTINRRC